MNDYNALYKLWCSRVTDEALLAELREVEGNEEEIKDRFWTDLTFGTGGLRGVLGAGTNRMNVYTVAKATQGLANYLNDAFPAPSVVIGYDSRINSDLFSRIAAEVLAANGVKVYLFPELIPTPVVAWAVRELSCASGIIITASHNPSKYNGYKCYDHRGYQMTDEAAAKTLGYINACDIFADVHRLDFEEGRRLGIIRMIPEAVIDHFFTLVRQCTVDPDATKGSDLSVIYTPLNGTGNKPVRRILKEIGLADVTVVPSQENPDGHFPTCPYPNPEIREAFNEALKLSETKKADLLLATDPDCDRVGIAVRDQDEYKLLTGNEVGCLLTNYILSVRKAQGTLPAAPVIVKSIVSTDMASAIAESYGAEVVNVLTGFKYIGEKMVELEEAGEPERFLLGFEESYGYLSGMHAKDKDAVNASMLICEMAAHYKKEGKTLVEVLNGLYETYGHWKNSLFNFYFEGADGMMKMAAMMDALRANVPATLGGKAIVRVTDYKTRITRDLRTGKTEEVTLPQSNVIVLEAENKDKIVVRPAGTEPKIKIYTMVQGASMNCAARQTEAYKKEMTRLLGIEE